MYEQDEALNDGALNDGALNDGEPQALGQEMMGVIEQVLPHPDNNQVDAYAQLLATLCMRLAAAHNLIQVVDRYS